MYAFVHLQVSSWMFFDAFLAHRKHSGCESNIKPLLRIPLAPYDNTWYMVCGILYQDRKATESIETCIVCLVKLENLF